MKKRVSPSHKNTSQKLQKTLSLVSHWPGLSAHVTASGCLSSGASILGSQVPAQQGGSVSRKQRTVVSRRHWQSHHRSEKGLWALEWYR